MPSENCSVVANDSARKKVVTDGGGWKCGKTTMDGRVSANTKNKYAEGPGTAIACGNVQPVVVLLRLLLIPVPFFLPKWWWWFGDDDDDGGWAGLSRLWCEGDDLPRASSCCASEDCSLLNIYELQFIPR